MRGLGGLFTKSPLSVPLISERLRLEGGADGVGAGGRKAGSHRYPVGGAVVVAVVMNAVLHIAYNALDVVLVLRPLFSYVLVIIKYSHNFILFSGTRKSTAPQVPVCGTSVGSSGFPASA